MTNDITAANLALELTRRHVGSARPDAPVVSDEAARPARIAGARLRFADSLRAVAGWVEPGTRKVAQAS